MKTLSLSEAKMKLSGLVDSVKKTDNVVVITKNGRPAAVLVNPDEYESWQETLEIRSDVSMMKEIKAGLAALKKKKSKLYTLDEIFLK
ncbi:MAG: prevent-host-death protein [Deltaproteobacteria bacterium RIFCSPLOWO2_12_FULL_40_28]|nr:MAG: prevent-host-death protein [Deltaproteobacteria bacterium RIFCSPHIGHO2_02_FULL_40_28]OGQ18882.1 MAG: prevent-host-death protein [Deltaproteobacteria bacterium RIFCSPHIGHO2_12_FULL_40_32]OGQ40127.1 MAG: prevent-host-death protein [Deltaproteobacteria bacterium RIFCSPLOWO2_02_FULL_40_36]OGQ53310.1 MAG: prevent-host-death protein [Deltaproteobacteria bacterium RIFCSPLOWO2_12_FULL_40_28]